MGKLQQVVKRLRGKTVDTDAEAQAILAGKRVAVRNRLPSVLFFTIHKAASTYVNQTLRDTLTAARYKHIDLADYSFRNTERKLELADSHFRPRGLYYGALREPIAVAPEKKCKTIVQVRDPRDVITSFYFSIVFSHSAPAHVERKRRFEQRRQELSQRGIDEYARKMETPTLRTLNQYADDFLGRKDVLIVHYEDMVNDFSSWMDRIVDYLELPRTRRTNRAIEAVKQAANFDVQKEDVFSHKRQVTPGDHLRKLEPETIQAMNRGFEYYFRKLKETDNLPRNYTLPDTDINLGLERRAA